MQKNKFGHAKTTLATLLLVSGSYACATPSTEEGRLDALWQRLGLNGPKPAQLICNDYPECPPDFAPEQKPTKSAEKAKK